MTTIKDVSRVAGVSIATVSRTLRNPEKVTEKTRNLVLKAVEETGYQPNMLARSFRTKKSHAILVLVPDMTNLFYSRVIRGIQRFAETRGYAVLLGDTGGDENVENRYAGFALSKQVDGVIQLSKHLPKPLEKLVLRDDPFPYVNACEFEGDPPYPTVGIDNELAQFYITEHLVRLGHKNFAVISGQDTIPISGYRLEGVYRALAENGLPDHEPLVAEGDYTIESGVIATEYLLSQNKPFTALVVFSDEMAFGAVQALKKAGKRIPDDVSVVGFDNISFARYCDPPLTTMSQPTERIGETAAHILFDQMEGLPVKNMKVRLPTDLIIRGSTKEA